MPLCKGRPGADRDVMPHVAAQERALPRCGIARLQSRSLTDKEHRMPTPSSKPAASKERDQPAKDPKSDPGKKAKPSQPQQQTGTPRGERPIADVDRKVRGGDA